MRQSRWNRKAFWRQTSAKYPDSFFAKTERPHPSPPNVTHRFSSTLVANGPRYWAFETEAQRDAFCKLYVGAQPLDGDPCP